MIRSRGKESRNKDEKGEENVSTMLLSKKQRCQHLHMNQEQQDRQHKQEENEAAA